MYAKAAGIGAEARGIGVDPLQCGKGIVDRGREFVLRPHPVIDRDDQCLGPGAQVAGDEIMSVEAADHMAAAMVVDDRRHRPAAFGQ